MKSPCGRSTTCWNCSRPIPSSASTRSETAVGLRRERRRSPSRHRLATRLEHRPLAALLRAVPGSGALDAVDRLPSAEAEDHPRRDVTLGAVGAEAVLGAVAGDFAVERERHRVEERRLPRAGRAVDEEQVAVAERREVDLLARAYGPNAWSVSESGLMAPQARHHAARSFRSISARASAKACRCSGPGRAFVTALKKLSKSFRSSRPAPATCCPNVPVPGARDELAADDVQDVGEADAELPLRVEHVPLVLERHLHEVLLVARELLSRRRRSASVPCEPNDVALRAERDDSVPGRVRPRSTSTRTTPFSVRPASQKEYLRIDPE